MTSRLDWTLAVLSPETAGGAAVLVISQDLDELFEISDRIAVIHRGEISEALPTAAWTREEIGLAMMGAAHAA